jgi:hypothetical protein
MAGTLDLTIVTGEDFTHTFAWISHEGVRRSFDPYTPYAQIRPRPGAPLIRNLTPYLTVVENQQVKLEDDSISTGQALRLFIPGAETASLPKGGVWDILLVSKADPTSREFLVYGKVTLRKGVTTYDG